MSRRVRLLFFAAGLALLALLVTRVGARTLLGDLRRAGWALVPIMLLWAGVYALNTVAWLLLVPPDRDGGGDEALGGRARRIPFARAYALSVASFALNYVTPFVALGGEALRAHAAAGWVGRRRAAVSTVAFRVVHTGGQLMFWLLTVPIAAALLPRTPASVALLALVSVVLLTGVVLLGAALRARTLERMLDALPRVPLLRRLTPALERRRPELLALDAELAAVVRERPARAAAALAIEAAGRFLGALEFALIGRSIGEPVSVGAAWVIASFSQLVMNMLFFVPFELGAKEGGLFAVFRLLGHAPHVGVYGAVVSRLREIAWITIGLVAIWLGAARSNGDVAPSASVNHGRRGGSPPGY